MKWLEIIFLAIVQGIGEFLPISSKGHIVLGDALFKSICGVEVHDILDIGIVLHFGTLLSILVFYWPKLLKLFKEDRLTIVWMIVGSIPVAVIGLLFKKQLEAIFEVPLYVGYLLPVTGLMLLWSAWHNKGETTCKEMTWWQALTVGIFQCFALLPGISRSGTTIVSGLGVGLRRDESAKFSFFLAIPAIAGAALLELKTLIKAHEFSTPIPMLLVGAAVSFVVGLVALWWLNRWLEKGRLHYFAYYVIALGAAVIVWQTAF